MTYISPRVPHPTASCPSQALAKRVTARVASLGAPFPLASMRPRVTQLSREPWVHRVSQSALSVFLQGEGGAALDADEDEDAGELGGSSGAGGGRASGVLIPLFASTEPHTRCRSARAPFTRATPPIAQAVLRDAQATPAIAQAVLRDARASPPIAQAVLRDARASPPITQAVLRDAQATPAIAQAVLR